MPGDLEPVSPGQPVQPTAGTWNAFIDAALAHRRNKGKSGGGPLDDLFESSLKCLVKYDASSITTLPAFSVLAYGPAIIDPATDDGSRLLANRRPVFTGATPSNAAAPFVVTAEPIQGQTLGRAITSGLAVVQVEVSNSSHTRACPIAGDATKLASGAKGVPIIFKESGTGTKWAIVNLGQVPQVFGLNYTTDPDSNYPIWPNYFVGPVHPGTYLFEWESTIRFSELFIPANSGRVWISGEVVADYSFLGTNNNLAMCATVKVIDLDNLGTYGDQYLFLKQFANGQSYLIDPPGSGIAGKRINTGAYVVSSSLGGGGAVTYQGSTSFGFVMDVGSTAKRLALRLGIVVIETDGANLDIDAFSFVLRHNGSQSVSGGGGVVGLSYFIYQPIGTLTTTPDFDALEVIFTEDPDNGVHASPHSVNFDSTVTGGVSPFTYAWDYSDTGTATTADPTHSFTYNGLFTPLLTVTDSVGQKVTTVGNPILVIGGSPPPPPTPPPPPPPPTPPLPPPPPMSPLCCPAAHNKTGFATIVGGTDAGTYPITWLNTSGLTIWTFFVANGTTYTIFCLGSTGDWKLVVNGVLYTEGGTGSCVDDVPAVTFVTVPNGASAITTS